MYDPQLGRWHAKDAMAELCYYESPYVFVGNNPMRYTDVGGYFKIDARFAKQYPTLAKMIQYYLPMLKDNPKVRAAFTEVTGFSDTQFDDMVTYGKGPWVTPTRPAKTGNNYRGDWMHQPSTNPAVGSGSRYDGKRAPDNLFIDKDVLMELEASLAATKNGTGNDLALNMFIVSLHVMHEATHYGVFKNGLGSKDHNPDDQGAVFEGLAYKQFSYVNENHEGEGMSRGKVEPYFNQSVRSTNGMGMTAFYNQWLNQAIFNNAPATTGQRGDPTLPTPPPRKPDSRDP